MSRIDELIAELCPDGVEFRELGEIAETVTGLSGKSKADFTGGNARYVTYKNAFANLEVDQLAPDYVQMDAGEKQNRLRLGDVVITGSSESLDEVGMSSVVASEPTEPLFLNSFCFVLRFVDRDLLVPGFSKYLFRSDGVRKQIRGTASGVTRINVSKVRFMKVRIPVPPLEVQREIVRILDQFTALEAELEAELATRRRQYQHYRDSLLTFTERERVRWTTLSDIAEFKYGFTAKAADSGRCRFIRITDINAWGKLIADGAKYVDMTPESEDYLVEAGDVLMARTGATYGKAMLVETIEPAVYASFLIRIRFPAADVEPSYYWHFAQSGLYWSQVNAMVSTGGQPQFNANALKQIEIAIPPLAEQRHIVEVLDNFDALVNDLSVGLPAELVARRKQYEHYRDRLLTFKEKMA